MTEPTLTDVAALAGVSVATASRALSGRRRVGAQNQRQIEKAARELGYRHNPLAGALRTQRSGAVGVLLPRFSSGFLSTVVEAVSTELDRQERTLTLRYAAQDEESAVAGIRALRDRRVDGIIVCAPSPSVVAAAVAAAGRVPLVLVGRHHDVVSIDSVGLDDERAAAILADHLDGRTERVFAAGFDIALPADLRRRALLEVAVRARGLEVTALPPVSATLDGGIAAAEHLLELIGRNAGGLAPTLVCANDDVAYGARAVLRMHGLRVPEDIMLASLMDVDFADRVDRTVTTLRHPWPEMGTQAAKLLDEALQESAESSNEPLGQPHAAGRRTVLTPRLIPGASTGAGR